MPYIFIWYIYFFSKSGYSDSVIRCAKKDNAVLINLDDKYLFVEKIAFEQPYQISVIKSKNDLIELFNNRSTYFGDESAKGPYIYENDKLLYEYKWFWFF